MRALATISVPSIGERRGNLPAELIDIVDRLLSRDPNERPESAAEVAELLAPFCEGHSLVDLAECGMHLAEQEPEPDSMTSLPSFVRGSGHGRIQSETGPETVDSQPPSSTRRWLIGLMLAPVILLAGFVIWIKVDSGTIVVECAEGNVPVQILKDEEFYRNVELDQGETTLTVRAGNYRLVLPKNYDRLKIENDRFTLERMGEKLVTISKNSDVSASSNANISPQVATPARKSQLIAVATKDLNPGDHVDASDVQMVAWPLSTIPQGSFVDPNLPVGQIVKTAIRASQPITSEHLATLRQLAIPKGMRVVWVTVHDKLSTLIKPGDLVDVHVRVPAVPISDSKLYTIDHQVKVFGMDWRRERSNEARLGHRVALVTTPQKGALMVAADDSCEIILALRRPDADGKGEPADHPPFTAAVLAQRQSELNRTTSTTGRRIPDGMIATPVSVPSEQISNEKLVRGDLVDVFVLSKIGQNVTESKALNGIEIFEIASARQGAPNQQRIVTLLLRGADADSLEHDLSNDAATGIRLKSVMRDRQPVYSGQTFDEWRREVETERNPSELEKAVRALCLLGRNHRDEEAARVVLGILGNYRGRPASLNPEGQLIHAAIDGIRGLNPEKIRQPFVDVLKQGNETQLYHAASWFLTPAGGIVGFGPTAIQFRDGRPLHRALAASPEIRQALVQAWARRTDRNQQALFEAIGLLVSRNGTDKGVIELLRQQAYDEESPHQLQAARLLAEAAPEPLLAQQFIRHIESDEARRDVRDTEWWERQKDAWIGLAFLGPAATDELHRLEQLLLTRFHEPGQWYASMTMGLNQPDGGMVERIALSPRILAVECLALGGKSRSERMRQVLPQVGVWGPTKLDPSGRYGVEPHSPQLSLEKIIRTLTEAKKVQFEHALIPNLSQKPQDQREEIAYLNSIVLVWERTTGSRARFRSPAETRFGPWNDRPPAPDEHFPKVVDYDGRKFAEWVDTLKNEKDPKRLVDGMKGVCLLTPPGQDAKAFEAILSVFDEARFPDFGFEGTMPARGQITTAALEYLRELNAIACEKSIVGILKQSKGRQWEFLVGYVLQPDFVTSGDMRFAQSSDLSELAAISTSIRDAVAEQLAGWEELPDTHRQWLLDLTANTRHRSNEPHFSGFLTSLLKPDSKATTSQRLTAAHLLLEEGEAKAACRDLLVKLLVESDDATAWLRAAAALELLKQDIAPVTQELIRLLERECAREESPAVVFSIGRNSRDFDGFSTYRGGSMFLVSRRICVVNLLGNIEDSDVKKAAVDSLSSLSGMKAYSGNRNSLGTMLQQLSQLPGMGGRFPDLKPVFAEAEVNEFKRSASAALYELDPPKRGPKTRPLATGDSPDTASRDPRTPMTVYDGRTFDQWLSICENERSPEQVEKAIRALGAIGREHRADEAVAQILQALSRFSTEGLDEDEPEGKLLRSIRDQLRLLDPEIVAEQVVSTVRTGNENQRRFLTGYFFKRTGRIGAGSYVQDAKRITNRLNVDARFEKALIEVWDDVTVPDDRYDLFQRLGEFNKGVDTSAEFTALLQRIVNDESSSMRVQAARHLSSIKPEADVLAPILVADLEKSLDDRHQQWFYERADAYLGLYPLASQPGKHIDEIARLLKAHADDDPHRHAIGVMLSNASGNIYGLLLSERVLLVELLGRAGPNAKAHVALLEEFVDRPVPARLSDYEKTLVEKPEVLAELLKQYGSSSVPTQYSSSVYLGDSKNVSATALEPLAVAVAARAALARITGDENWLTEPIRYEEPEGVNAPRRPEGFSGRGGRNPRQN